MLGVRVETIAQFQKKKLNSWIEREGWEGEREGGREERINIILNALKFMRKFVASISCEVTKS